MSGVDPVFAGTLDLDAAASLAIITLLTYASFLLEILGFGRIDGF